MNDTDTDAVKAKACFARAMIATNKNWQVAYELVNGERTGRWQLLSESGEEDQWWPGHWFPAFVKSA